jgi:hypothetical protein
VSGNKISEDSSVERRHAAPADSRKKSESEERTPYATRAPLERVMVLDDGCAWNGRVYRSLSQVAKAITGTNWNGRRFFGLKAVRNGALNRKGNATPRPNRLLDIGMSPTLAAFALATAERSPPLATKESDSPSPSELVLRSACEVGPTARQLGPRQDPRSGAGEVPRQGRGVREVGR